MGKDAAAITPMMAQFLAIKAEYPNALLFYRMGDFYEMFFDDAVAAAEALDITLTKRGKHLGEDIAMCGVPVHAAESYLLTLIRKGFRVAVCEQMEDPAEARKRGSKSVVKREVVRLVTPGTLTEESLLDARRHNFLCSYNELRDEAALAWVDVSTGAFHVMPLSAVRLGPEIARLAPSEVILSEQAGAACADVVEESGAALSRAGSASFDSSAAEQRLLSLFQVSSLDAFGSFSRAELSVMGAIVDYLDITQKGRMPMLHPPRREVQSVAMQIDAATRRNLELSQALSGGRAGTLLAAIDRTVTSGGGRLLDRRLASPSRDLTVIKDRLDAVGFALEQTRFRDETRKRLRQVPDLERALSRLALQRGGPRDLAAIRDGMKAGREIAQDATQLDLPEILRFGVVALNTDTEVTKALEAALAAEPPLLARDGGFIRQGYDSALDNARALRDEGRTVIARMQSEYQALSGINALKIKHNNVLGYFVEVPATHSEKMLSAPLCDTFRHRQTTAGQIRFTTPDLTELQSRILNASGEALDIEKGHFEALRALVLDHSALIAKAAKAIAEIDLALSLGHLAQSENWCRPMVDDSRRLEIVGGRHPVVEQALRHQGMAEFIANDLTLSPEAEGAAIWLLTGPNMAGKSTFLRQNALIVLLAQMGSFVPAERAEIGVVSQLFSRVGASDDLARGRSTFMVEMVETAAILNQADDRALVILDEIGRGTATYDGLSIAWATLEHLHGVNQCRALFATHYHELTSLSSKLSGVDNATVAVREWKGDVIFLHEVRKGAADRSYGVQVAKLAGLPESVISRARVILAALEEGEHKSGGSKHALIDDLPLFSAASSPLPEPKKPVVLDLLEDLHPDELSPREALEALYALKAQMQNES